MFRLLLWPLKTWRPVLSPQGLYMDRRPAKLTSSATLAFMFSRRRLVYMMSFFQS